MAALKALQASADDHAERLRPVLDELARQGVTSLGAVASALNERSILTPRGASWHKSSVRNLMDRLRARQRQPGAVA